MFRDATLARLRDRVGKLQSHFTKALVTFERTDLFAGPSFYFHHRTLEILRQHGSAVEAMRDNKYLEALYATLTAWGLHRMGPGNAKLLDFVEMRRNLLSNATRIEELERMNICHLKPETVAGTARKLGALLNHLRVSRARTFLVSSSKALHHLLPALVPPVDNEYTLSFFFHSMILDGDNDAEVFETIYPYFCELARRNEAVIRKTMGRGCWHTSETKVLDNAIVGYCLKHDV